jgi:hypothetical protein
MQELELGFLEMKKLIALSSLLPLLVGCASAESLPEAQELPAVKNFIASAAPEATSEVVTFADVVKDSYELFLENGMTEEVTSGGDRYILTYEPGEEFVAALYNFDFDDVVGVEQKELFTVYSAWVMLSEQATVIEQTDQGYSLSHPDYGSFVVFVEEDLIVGGEGIDAGWTGVFRYEPDPDILALLESEPGDG